MSAPYVDIYDNTIVVYTKIKELNTDLTSFTVDNFVTYDVAFKIPRPVAVYYLPKDFALNESTAMPERLRYSVYFEYNLDTDHDWPSTASSIDDVTQYYQDIEWSIAPIIPSGSLDPNDPAVQFLELM